MKLNEIKYPYLGHDASDYRRGDEDLPGSPYYQEKTTHLDNEEVEIENYELYDDENKLIGKAKITVDVDADFDLRHPKDGWTVNKFKITNIELNGQSYTEEELKKQFGETFDRDTLKDEITSNLDKHNHPGNE